MARRRRWLWIVSVVIALTWSMEASAARTFEALKEAPVLQTGMFQTLHGLANGQD